MGFRGTEINHERWLAVKWGLRLQCCVGNLVGAMCLPCGVMCLGPYMQPSRRHGNLGSSWKTQLDKWLGEPLGLSLSQCTSRSPFSGDPQERWKR